MEEVTVPHPWCLKKNILVESYQNTIAYDHPHSVPAGPAPDVGVVDAGGPARVHLPQQMSQDARGLC